MPKIPIYSDQSNIPVLEANRIPRVDVSASGEMLARSGLQLSHTIAQIGERFAEQEDKLEKQQEELDIANMSGQYSGREAELQMKILQEPELIKNPGLMRQAYIDGEQEIRKSIRDTARTENVQMAFDRLTAKALPMNTVEITAKGYKVWVDQQLGQLEQMSNTTSDLAAASIDPRQRDAYMQVYLDTASRMRDRGYMTQQKYEETTNKYKETVSLKNMQFMAKGPETRGQMRINFLKGDYSLVNPTDALKVFEMADHLDKLADEKIKKAQKEVAEAVHNNLSSLANQGLLSQSIIDDMLSGKMLPSITPEQARVLANVNENPPGGAGTQAVLSAMTDYHAGPVTMERISNARKSLMKIQETLDRPSKALNVALNELQGDELHLRNTNANEYNAGVKLFDNTYDELYTPSMNLPGMIGTIDKNRAKREKGEGARKIRDAVGRGESAIDAARDAIEELKKKRAEQEKSKPPSKKNIEELNRGR